MLSDSTGAAFGPSRPFAMFREELTECLVHRGGIAKHLGNVRLAIGFTLPLVDSSVPSSIRRHLRCPSRGSERRLILRSDRDRLDFIDFLGAGGEVFRVSITAKVLLVGKR